jgi:hypothetical protein
MAILTQEEIELNTSGFLSPRQIKQVRKKGIVQLIGGTVFLVLVPTSVLMADLRLGVLLIVWLVLGLLFAGIFLYSALGYFKIKQGKPHTIIALSGIVKVKTSGNRNVVVTINERSFFMMKNEAALIIDGKEYTLHYLEDQIMVIGWLPLTK